MYASILERTGIHLLEDAGSVSGNAQSDAGLLEVWREMSASLGCELNRSLWRICSHPEQPSLWT